MRWVKRRRILQYHLNDPTPMERLQTYEKKVMRAITDAYYYVRNMILQRDFKLETMEEFVNVQIKKLYAGLVDHFEAFIKELGQYDSKNLHHKQKTSKLLLRSLSYDYFFFGEHVYLKENIPNSSSARETVVTNFPSNL